MTAPRDYQLLTLLDDCFEHKNYHLAAIILSKTEYVLMLELGETASKIVVVKHDDDFKPIEIGFIQIPVIGTEAIGLVNDIEDWQLSIEAYSGLF